MRTFAQKQKPTHKTKSASSTKPSWAFIGQSREVSSILHLQRTIGNHAVLRLLQANREKREDRSLISTSPCFAHELTHRLQQGSLIESGAIQTKLVIGQPNDIYEQEAGRVAAAIVRIPDTAIEEQPEGAEALLQANAHPEGAFEVPPEIETQISSEKGGGQSLPGPTQSFFGSKFGTDFVNVRVHTGSAANQLNKQLDSRAFTTGNHIFFREGEYNPDTSAGKRLLAHELTHVVQQKALSHSSTQMEMIQRTRIGDILRLFFSLLSHEHVWRMDESDPYTAIVRRWQPVINAVEDAKRDLEGNCENWSQNHMTDPSWSPGTDPTVPNAWSLRVRRPPGTDPETARGHYIFSQVTGFQSDVLHTSSIGSFRIFVTTDQLDCARGRSTLQVWMWNAMTRSSFGDFAEELPFSISGMATQTMWWNWTEEHKWTPGGGSRESSGTATGPAPPEWH